MPENKNKGGTNHYGSYPPGYVHPLLAYAFRPFFILLPAYVILSIVLWGLTLNGVFPLLFLDNPFAWHIYEMLFGTASAGIIAFILTAVPEFYEGAVPVVGKKVAGIVLLWILGRVAFWSIKWVGVYPVALTNLPLLIWIVVLVAKPIFMDPLRRNISLALTFIMIILIQGWFFASMAGLVAADFMSILKVGVGAFMVLELLALRRVNTEAINEWLDDQGIDDTFMARPPRYNIAILCVVLFTGVEFFFPGNSILGWLGLAAGAAILNTLNDFFLDESRIFLKPNIFPLFLILVLMAAGYGLMGWDYLNEGFFGVNHFRHFLTSGVIGLSYLMVMVIVGTIHTGRQLKPNRWIDFSVLLIVVGTLLRVVIPFWPEMVRWLYMWSAIVWAVPFGIYLILYYPILRKPRADGLPG